MPVAEYIHKALRGMAVPVESLTLDLENAVTHDQRNIEMIMRSMSKFGQDVPLVVQQSGDKLIVRKGNGRLKAAIELGWESIAVIVVYESDTQGIARAIMDNRSSDFHVWDDDQLQDLLSRIEDDFSLDDMGWDAASVEALVVSEPIVIPPEENNQPQAPADNVLKRITFVTTDEQSTIIHNAVERLRSSENDSTITMSRAMELICADFIAGH